MTPVVAETCDGFLNDINGFHVKKEHVFQALDNAMSGPVQEGNVGGGTGMVCSLRQLRRAQQRGCPCNHGS